MNYKNIFWRIFRWIFLTNFFWRILPWLEHLEQQQHEVQNEAFEANSKQLLKEHFPLYRYILAPYIAEEYDIYSSKYRRWISLFFIFGLKFRIRYNYCKKVCTGKSVSEALILASVNPQYDSSLNFEFSTRKIQVQNMLCTKIVLNVKTKQKTIFVHNMFRTGIFLVLNS